jgi:hypothetical protein
MWNSPRVMMFLAFLLCIVGWMLSGFFALSGNQMLMLKFDLVGYTGLAALLVIGAIKPKE